MKRFNEHPEAAIAELHRDMVATGGDQDLLFALAEVSFLHGDTVGNPAYQLAAAVYAYAFLFPEGGAPARDRSTRASGSRQICTTGG